MVKFLVGNEVLCRTDICKNTRNPDWKELFAIDVCHEAQRITFKVGDMIGIDSK